MDYQERDSCTLMGGTKMPRTGQRPYECVRRAWHSDRHQPMRGNLIQEIFRIASEIHSTETKKKKEWQEKLPVVVLKAEEIMYSKANSEAEYMDFKTLWDRTNDAINIIIRLDESTETGDLLQPCIEAALTLGCTPRRASRSQRNNNPCCYLSPSTPPGTLKLGSFSAGTVHDAIQASRTTKLNPAPTTSLHSAPNCSNFGTSTIGNLARAAAKSPDFVFQKNNDVASNKSGCTIDNVPLPNKNKCPPALYPVSGLWSVYPLYSGSYLELQNAGGMLTKSVPSTSEPVKAGVARNPFCEEGTSVKTSQARCWDQIMNPREVECDLSLRLGSVSAASQVVENRQLQDIKDIGSSCFVKKNKFNDRMPLTDKNFLFCPLVDADDPLDTCSSNLGEHANVDLTMKKRKAVFSQNLKDHAFGWPPKHPYNQSTSRTKFSGL